MDRIFDRLGDLLRSTLQNDEGAVRDKHSQKFHDPDMEDAWEELNDFLGSSDGKHTESGPHRSRYREHYTRPTGPPEELRKDFKNLEIPFGAKIEDVRKSYKKLMVKYHPDRHAGNREQYDHATEITQRINQSFHRIKEYYERSTK